jgi:hypothetical protein
MLSLKDQKIEASELTSSSDSGPSNSPNFVTECFFLTVYALHIGFNPIIRNYTSLLKDLNELQKARQHLLNQQSRETTVR